MSGSGLMYIIPYYFSYWDKCRKGHMLQHYEAAKIYLKDGKPIAREMLEEQQNPSLADELDQQFRATMGRMN